MYRALASEFKPLFKKTIVDIANGTIAISNIQLTGFPMQLPLDDFKRVVIDLAVVVRNALQTAEINAQSNGGSFATSTRSNLPAGSKSGVAATCFFRDLALLIAPCPQYRRQMP